MVERWRAEGNECEVGAKAAMVGGLTELSGLSGADCPPFAEADEGSDMDVIQGVSVDGRQPNITVASLLFALACWSCHVIAAGNQTQT